MPIGSLYTASIAAAAIMAAFTAFFFRRRRNSSSSLLAPPTPASSPPVAPLLFVAGHRLVLSQFHSLCSSGFTPSAHHVYLLSGTNAAALDERMRQRVQSLQPSSATASLMQSSSFPSMFSRASSQNNSRRPDLLPDAPPPVISDLTRAYVAELQNKCAHTAFFFKTGVTMCSGTRRFLTSLLIRARSLVGVRSASFTW
jgi:hypothetical protein